MPPRTATTLLKIVHSLDSALSSISLEQRGREDPGTSATDSDIPLEPVDAYHGTCLYARATVATISNHLNFMSSESGTTQKQPR